MLGMPSFWRPAEWTTFPMAETPKRADRQEIARRVERGEKLLQKGKAGEALEEFLSRPGGKPIIVAGSLYLVGQARALLAGGQIGEGRP